MANLTFDEALGRRLVKILCIFFESFNKMNIMNAIEDYEYLSVAN